MAPLVELKTASLGYPGRPVLRDLDLAVHAGERIALLGRSGAGKSTLLNALYDRLATQAALIPQAASLVPQLSTFHNVYMGRLDRHGLARNLRELVWPSRPMLDEVEAVLARVDLAPAIRQRAGSLSGGQAQRCSVARAVFNGRAIVLGDEPVSALDRRQGSAVLATMRTAHATSILALHDIGLALEHATRVLVLRAGRVVLDMPSTGLAEAELAAACDA